MGLLDGRIPLDVRQKRFARGQERRKRIGARKVGETEGVRAEDGVGNPLAHLPRIQRNHRGLYGNAEKAGGFAGEGIWASRFGHLLAQGHPEGGAASGADAAGCDAILVQIPLARLRAAGGAL